MNVPHIPQDGIPKRRRICQIVAFKPTWVGGVCLLATIVASLGARPANPPAKLLRGGLLSDIHFDPLADTTLVPQLIKAPIGQWDAIFKTSKKTAFAQYGSDSNYPLMMSALAQAKKQAPNGYVLFTGDALRHDFNTAFVSAGGTAAQFPAFATKTMTFVVDKLQKDFKVPVVVALGNNDTASGDYAMPTDSSFLIAASRAIKVVADSPNPNNRTTFRYGGYYTMQDPSTHAHEFVVLNTVLWSPDYSNGSSAPQPASGPGEKEMAWLTAELQKAKAGGQKVRLVMHIPPGMNAYSSSTGSPTLMWTAPFTSQFNALMDKYQGTLVTSFCGHTHMDDFRVYSNPKPIVAFRTTPAVSPDFGNNPGFSIFTFAHSSGEISDVKTYYYPLTATAPKWAEEYDFLKTYGLKAYNAATLASLAPRIRANGSSTQSYEKYYDVSALPLQITSATLPAFSCSETSFSVNAFQACMGGSK